MQPRLIGRFMSTVPLPPNTSMKREDVYKRQDDVLPAHEVNEAAVKRGAEFALFMLNVQRDDILASLTAVDHQELHKIRLALAGVAEDKNIRRSLVLIALVKVCEDVAAVSVLADVEAMRIGFT